MEISDQELRDLVRDAIGRQRRAPLEPPAYFLDVQRHSSHLRLPVAPGSDLDDGACVIEPAVRCTHCGYCQSFGH
jgi:hypothetical protein